MEVACFNAQRQVVLEKPPHPGGGLKVEFERMRQVRWTYARCGYPGSSIHIGYPTGACRKIIPQVWGQAHQPVISWRELLAAEQLTAKLPVAPIPVTFSFYRTKHVAIRKA